MYIHYIYALYIYIYIYVHIICICIYICNHENMKNCIIKNCIYITPVHIVMARNRVSKSFLMAEFCFHGFLHFDCVPIYIWLSPQAVC